MKLFACNLLLLPDGQTLSPAVVRLDADGRLLSWYALEREEHGIIWLGGLCVARECAGGLRVWHTADLSLRGAKDFDTSAFRILGREEGF